VKQLQETLKLWLEKAEYDFESAKIMLSNNRYLYVAFMCQQTIEKLLKGIIHQKTKALPPYTHNLTALAQMSDISFSKEQLDFFILLTSYYLNTRYPDIKQKLALSLNRGRSQEMLMKTEEFFLCLKKELKI